MTFLEFLSRFQFIMLLKKALSKKKGRFWEKSEKMMKKGLKKLFEVWKPDAHIELAKTIILMYHMLMFEIRIENAPILKKWYFWNFKRRLWRHQQKNFRIFSWILGQNRALFPSSTKKGGVIFSLRIPYWNSSFAPGIKFYFYVRVEISLLRQG